MASATQGSVTIGDGLTTPFFQPDSVLMSLGRVLENPIYTTSTYLEFRAGHSRLSFVARGDNTGDRSLRPPVSDSEWDRWQALGNGVLLWNNPHFMRFWLDSYRNSELNVLIPIVYEIQGIPYTTSLSVERGQNYTDVPHRSVAIPVHATIPIDGSSTWLTHMPWINRHDNHLLGALEDWVTLIGVSIPVGMDVDQTVKALNDMLSREHPFLIAQRIEDCMDFLFADITRVEQISLRFQPLIWIISMIVVVTTQFAVLESRRKELHIYHLLGMETLHLWFILVSEAIVVISIGVAIGSLATAFLISSAIGSFIIDWGMIVTFLTIAFPSSLLVLRYYMRSSTNISIGRAR
jgi:hypothetical protein